MVQVVAVVLHQNGAKKLIKKLFFLIEKLETVQNPVLHLTCIIFPQHKNSIGILPFCFLYFLDLFLCFCTVVIFRAKMPTRKCYENVRNWSPGANFRFFLEGSET